MARKQHAVCSECGARLAAGAGVCDLCGLPVSPEADTAAEGPPAAPPAVEAQKTAAEGVFCNQCGWQNPAGARFCSMCGTRLQEVSAGADPASGAPAALERPVPAADRPAAAEPADNVKRQVGILVGAGLLLVVALYLVTVFSKNLQAGQAPAGREETSSLLLDEQESLPLPPQVAQQAAALEQEIEQLEGADRLDRQRQLVSLFLGAGRVDRAALEQEKVARAEDTAEAWTQAGNYYYDWMETAQDEHKPEVARKVIAAYQRVLEKEPDNLDVRTDMAVAYQYDPQHPMEAITQTNQVLEQDPNHVQANFNKGIFLLRINRLDQALEYFEKVQTLEAEGSPIYNRAREVADYIRDLQQGTGS